VKGKHSTTSEGAHIEHRQLRAKGVAFATRRMSLADRLWDCAGVAEPAGQTGCGHWVAAGQCLGRAALARAGPPGGDLSSNEFFRLWLDSAMIYSCGYFSHCVDTEVAGDYGGDLATGFGVTVLL
jgi:hypothetical protein